MAIRSDVLRSTLQKVNLRVNIHPALPVDAFKAFTKLIDLDDYFNLMY